MKNVGRFVMALFVVLCIFGAFCVPAVMADVGGAAGGSGGAPQADAVFQTGMSWTEVVKSGGWPMYILGVMSVLTAAFVLYFIIVLRAGQVVPAPLYRELIEKIDAGMTDEAMKACEYHPSPLSAVALSAMEHIKNDPGIDSAMLKDVVESEGERQADDIQGQTQYLLDIGVIAPMVGLLGTVLGMLQAFSGVALSSALAKPVVLAGGVSKALITTAAGLIVAIPAMIAYSIFRRRAAKLVSYLESASTEMLTALIKERK